MNGKMSPDGPNNGTAATGERERERERERGRERDAL